MKKLFYLPILAVIGFIAVSLLSSCKKHPAICVVKTDVQFSFNNDRVQVFLDGKQLFDKVITTDSLAAVSVGGSATPDTIKEGTHTLTAIISGVSFTEKFSLKKNLYIGVQYWRATKKIQFVYSDEPFQYL